MGFSKENMNLVPAILPAPLVQAPATGISASVRGQVAMHAIETGYQAASRLVLTLAPKPEAARELLHTLAAEIAAKIEAYSFHE